MPDCVGPGGVTDVVLVVVVGPEVAIEVLFVWDKEDDELVETGIVLADVMTVVVVIKLVETESYVQVNVTGPVPDDHVIGT